MHWPFVLVSLRFPFLCRFLFIPAWLSLTWLKMKRWKRKRLPWSLTSTSVISGLWLTSPCSNLATINNPPFRRPKDDGEQEEAGEIDARDVPQLEAFAFFLPIPGHYSSSSSSYSGFAQVFHLFLYWTGTKRAVKEHKYVQALPASDERDCDVSPFEGREGNLFAEGRWVSHPCIAVEQQGHDGHRSPAPTCFHENARDITSSLTCPNAILLRRIMDYYSMFVTQCDNQTM